MSITYIHYGASEFDPHFSKQHTGDEAEWMHRLNKPHRGLWGCRKDSEYGWKEWCEDEEFRTSSLSKHFCFKLAKNAKILRLKSPYDCLKYEMKPDDIASWDRHLDMTKIMDEYDGMEVLNARTETLRYRYFYGWDVDSIVVWNIDKVIPVKE